MTKQSSGSQRRQQTRSGIYQHIYKAAEMCTKQSLARDLHLSLPTVYQHLTELMEEGLICYSGEQQSTGGRKASGLSVVSDARFAIGISVTENRLRMVAADLRLQELAYRKLHHQTVTEMSQYPEFLARELELFLDQEHLDRSKLLGVGIALPGVISLDAHQLIVAPTLNLRNTSLRHITDPIPYPTHVENDATCGGFAEWFMRGNQANMAYLSLENGVGGAVMVGGTVYTGDNLRSGEFGHMCVEPGGLLCKCGKQGCLEAYCSARRISDDLDLTLPEFFTRLERHVPEYDTLWHDVLRHLAIGINNIRMALDCEIVVGGFLTEYLEPYFPLLRQYVKAMNTFEAQTDYLSLSILRRHAVPLGAALHFIATFLENI